MSEKGLLKEVFASLESSLNKLTERVHAARNGAALEDLNLTAAGLSGAERGVFRADIPAVPNAELSASSNTALRSSARSSPGHFTGENMKKKPLKLEEITEEAKLRELAAEVNPLAKLIIKNQQRAAAKATEPKPVRDTRLPRAGTVLERQYKGRKVSVLVLECGFEYEGKRYKSLSAAASAITGQHVSGYFFFKL